MDNRVNFMERGAGTPIYPYFDQGWWLWGDLFKKAVTWNVAGFTGAGMDFDYPKGDIDDHKDVFGRLFVSPFRNTDIRFLQGLHLCAEGSLGDQSIPTKRFEQKGYSAAVRDDKFWTWETEDPGTGEVGSWDRWGFEVHYILGPFSLSSEYLVAQYENIRVFATDGSQVLDENGQVRSWSTWLSYYLTGESKGVSNFGWKAPNPDRDFNPIQFKGTGAWEVLFRYTYTKTSSNLFESVLYAGDTYRILEGADEVNEFTVGVCWTWNPMLRWQLNYVHLEGDGILTGDKSNEEGTKRVDHEDMFGLRMIFKF
jgi:phosphate-selective porin